MNKNTYEFGGFRLDLEQKRLQRNGQTVALQPKVFNMLVFFVEKRGELVSRDELMQAVWKDTFVEETNLRFCIHALRKALGKNADGKDYIETVPTHGYRFTAEADEKSSEIVGELLEESAPPKIIQKTQSAKRNWLIGISAFSVFCLLILAFAWQGTNIESPKNTPGINTLAVLPFASVGESAETDAALQTGLADAMINTLSKIKQLKVLPLASIRKFTGQNFDALAVGRELKTDMVLEGSYRFDGENVRVTANLLRVSDGAVLWTETLTSKKSNNLELENFISLRTARLLSLKFAQSEDEKSLAGTSLNTEAVQNYLSGRKIWQSRERERRDEMIRYFKKAIELEPNWSPGFSGLAGALLSEDSLLTDWKTVEQAARKALELDERDAQAHTALAQIYHRKYWDWENAEKSFKKAIEINPNYAPAHHEYSIFLGIRRRFVEAKEELEKAIGIEPFSPFYYASLCELNYFDRQYEEALAQCRYAENLEADFWHTRKQLFWIYAQKKMYPEISEMILGKLSTEEKAKHPLTGALQKNDFRLFWQILIDERLKTKRNISQSLALATFYMQIDEKEKALSSLEQSLEKREYFLPTINADPIFDSIRSEKRFIDIIQKIGL